MVTEIMYVQNNLHKALSLAYGVLQEASVSAGSVEERLDNNYILV